MHVLLTVSFARPVCLELCPSSTLVEPRANSIFNIQYRKKVGDSQSATKSTLGPEFSIKQQPDVMLPFITLEHLYFLLVQKSASPWWQLWVPEWIARLL